MNWKRHKEIDLLGWQILQLEYQKSKVTETLKDNPEEKALHDIYAGIEQLINVCRKVYDRWLAPSWYEPNKSTLTYFREHNI